MGLVCCSVDQRQTRVPRVLGALCYRRAACPDVPLTIFGSAPLLLLLAPHACAGFHGSAGLLPQGSDAFPSSDVYYNCFAQNRFCLPEPAHLGRCPSRRVINRPVFCRHARVLQMCLGRAQSTPTGNKSLGATRLGCCMAASKAARCPPMPQCHDQGGNQQSLTPRATNNEATYKASTPQRHEQRA